MPDLAGKIAHAIACWIRCLVAVVLDIHVAATLNPSISTVPYVLLHPNHLCAALHVFTQQQILTCLIAMTFDADLHFHHAAVAGCHCAISHYGLPLCRQWVP